MLYPIISFYLYQDLTKYQLVGIERGDCIKYGIVFIYKYGEIIDFA